MSTTDPNPLGALIDSGEELDEARRAALLSVIDYLPTVTDQLGSLYDTADLTACSLAADAKATVEILRRALDLLDALGWPTSEWEANHA
jgi:hypothetical protein